LQVCSKCKVGKEVEHFVWDSRYDRPKKKCKACDAATYKEYRLKNKDKTLARNKTYRSLNPKFRKAIAKKSLVRDKLYKPQRAAREAKRRFSKLNATPSWLTEAHIEQINQIYWHCADLRLVTGEQYHVDHIIPLRGKNVCGLHTPWNLQILPSDLNIRKSNK
jgi:hypothetical protein